MSRSEQHRAGSKKHFHLFALTARVVLQRLAGEIINSAAGCTPK
jgi:hypothetical protein